MALSDKVNDKTVRSKIVTDCTKLMDEQVSAKGGLSGLALKAAYGAVKGIGPSYIPGAIERLLPDAFAALDPMWSEGVQAGDPVGHLSQNRERTAEALLGVTDARIQHSNNGIIRSSYSKLRKSVKTDIESAIPGLAQIIGTHIQE
jgi:hypothetical protein